MVIPPILCSRGTCPYNGRDGRGIASITHGAPIMVANEGLCSCCPYYGSQWGGGLCKTLKFQGFGLDDTPSIDSIIGAPGAKASKFHAPHAPPIYPIIGVRSPGANPFTVILDTLCNDQIKERWH